MEIIKLAETPAIFEQIIALHQQIQAFVEQEIPHYYVKHIEQIAVTSYMLPKDGAPPLVLSLADTSFQVLAWRPVGQVTCEVRVTSEGKFILDRKRFETYT